MNGTVKRFVFVLALICLGAALPVSAQSYPAKPIRFLAPLPPGSAIDVVARTLGDTVAKKLGQPLTVENRAGANTNISTDACAKAAPDGYTICLITYSISLNPYLYPKMPFDAVRDLAPITNLVARINAEFVDALRQPAVRERFHSMGLEPAGNSVEEFTRYVAEDQARGQRLVKATGARLE